MKRNVLVIGAFLLCNLATANDSVVYVGKKEVSYTKEKIGFTYLAGCNIVSNYLWRGFSVGGLSLQPNFNVGYGGLTFGTWWNIGANDNQFKDFFPEVDTYIQFSRWGASIRLTHMFYFCGSNFFDFRQKAIDGGGNTNNIELSLSYVVSKKIPLSVEWYTHIAGEDGYVVDNNGNFVASYLDSNTEKEGLRLKRAFSSYFQVGYDFALPYDIFLPVRVGMTPWKSRYTQYKGNFALCCISLSLERSFDLKVCTLNVFGRAMLNPYHINKDNVVVKISERNRQDNQYNQHLNGTLGLGIWF